MKTLAKYLSLLLLSRLILPYCLTSGTVVYNKRLTTTQSTGKQCHKNAQSFWFLRDVASNIFPMLKNLN